MENQQQRQQQDQDLLADPNLLMAVAMVKSITNLIDKTSLPNEDIKAHQTYEENFLARVMKSPAQILEAAKIEAIEVAPVQELVEKLRSKTLLGRDEVNAITQCLTMHFCDDAKKFLSSPAQATRLREVLWLAYYVILNAHAYGQGNNYLDQQALQKLIKQVLSLIKSVLEVVNKKDQAVSATDAPGAQAHLFNSLLPPALKVIALFQTPAVNDQQHYKYLRASNLKLETLSLGFLNQVLTEILPHIYGKIKGQKLKTIAVKVEEVIQLIGTGVPQLNPNLTDDEFMMSMLEYVPPDYEATTQSLQQQQLAIKVEVDDESMSMDEESKQTIETVGQVCKDHIHKLKLVEQLSKAVDRMVTIANSENDFFLILDSKLFSLITKNIEVIAGLKPKLLASFLQKSLTEKAIKAQNMIIDHFGKLEDIDRIMTMEIDQMMEQPSSDVELKSLQDNVSIIAKSLEITVQTKDSQLITELIKQSQNLKYLSQLIKTVRKKPQMVQMIQSITQTLCNHLRIQAVPEMPHNESVDLMVLATRLVLVSRALNDIKSTKDKKKNEEEKQIVQAQPVLQSELNKSSLPNIRTRGQMKKEQTTSTQKDHGKKESTKIVEIVPQMTIVQVDASDLLKNAMNLLTKVMPLYFKNSSQLTLSSTLLRNLYALASNTNPQISRLVYGILSEFTRPGHSYSEDSLILIREYILKKLSKITSSHTKTVLTIKLMFLTTNLKNDDTLALKVETQLAQGQQWVSKKGIPAKSVSEMYSPKNLDQYLLYISCLLIMSKSSAQCGQLTDLLMKELSGEQLVANLHLLQLSLLNKQTLGLFKPSIHNFLTQLYSDTDPEVQLMSLISDVDKVVMKISNATEQIYDSQLLHHIEGSIGIESMIERLQVQAADKSASDLKALMNVVIKQVVKINSEIRPQEDINVGAIDIESYIGMQMSLGLSNLGLMHSRYELSSNTQTQEICQKLQSKIGLTNDDVEMINALHRSIKYLAELVERASIQCLKEQCAANEGTQTNSDGIALILRESTKGQAPNQKLCRLQQLTLGLPVSSNNKAHDMIQLILEPQQLAKHIAQVKTHSLRLEEVIYSHCFSIVSEIPGFQIFTSQCMLLKQLFQNITQILNVHNDKEYFIQEVCVSLLMIKYDNPFIEYMETGSHNFDFDQSDKIMNKYIAVSFIQTGTFTNRDFIKMRNLDSALHSIFIAQSVIKASKQSQQMQAVVNEIAQSFVQFSNYKLPSDINLISAMLNNSSQQSPFSRLFSQVMKCGQTTKDIYSQIWTQAFQYLQMSTFESDVDQLSQVSKENKGGIQMVINFAPENKRGKPKANKGMTLGQKKAPVEQELMQLDQPADAEVVQQKVINVTALKLLNFLGDAATIDKNSSKEHVILSQVFRQAFLRSDDDLTFIQLLHETKQVQLLKKIVSALLHQDSTETSEKRTQIQQKLFKSLVNFIKREGMDSLEDEKSAIMVSIELAQIMTDNNKQLIQFISEQILQGASRLIGDASSTKLIILDLLCQLAQTKFSLVDKTNQVAKYNTDTIIERRKLQQVVRRRKDEDKQRLLEQSQIESHNLDGEDTVMGESAQTQDGQGVEGFKQEKFEKDSDYQKYMERHEEVCTFTSTKKEFTTQHWYFCYTCRLTDNSGCCSVCAHKCHKGHQVVYSKKSNFFCDCGDSGNCQCLNPGGSANNPVEANKRPPSQKRRIREDHMPMPDRGLHLQGGMFSQQMQFGGYGAPPRQIVPPQRNQPLQFMNPSNYVRNIIMQQHQEDEHAMMLQQLGSYIDPLPQEFMRNIGGPGGMRFLDENSEEDQLLGDFIPQAMLQHHENRMIINDDDDDSDEDMDRHMGDHLGMQQNQNIKKIMKHIKNVPKNPQLQNPLSQPPIFDRINGRGRIEQFKIKKPVSPMSLSQVSSVNPLEDPFSDAGGQTPVLHQNFMMGDTIESFSPQEDDASISYSMEVLQLSQDFIEYLKNEQRHFDGVFNHLLLLIDEGSSLQPIQSIVDHSSNKKDNNHLLSPKQSVLLTQDLAQNKKIFRESTFAIRVQNDSKNAVQQNINLLDVMDVNKDGLVAVCEDQEITFYAGSQFFDAVKDEHDSEQFSFLSKEGAQISKIESQKLGFQPLQVRFNPAQPQYCAAVGSQNVEVIALTKQGKIAYKIAVELLLEAISKDITIVNINWMPGSQSTLAIVTRDFIKIYDLAQDAISPIYNIMVFNGFITDITFSQHTVIPTDHSRAEATIYVASSIGNVYYQDISYKLNSFQIRTEEEKMQCDSDNSDLMLTETLVFDAKHNIKENITKCLSVYCTQGNMLFISFSNGVTLVGKRVKDNGQFEDFKINVQEDPSFNGSSLKAIWQRFGESLVNFKEIGFTSSGGENKLYLTAYSRRQGSNFNQSGIPLLLEISETKVTVNVVKNCIMGSSNQTIIPVIGQAYIKNSHKSSQSMRLVNIMMDGSAATYTCKTLNDQLDEAAKPKSNGVKNGNNIETMINRADLPKEVKLTINFFEKQKNLFNDANLRAKLNFTGDIVSYFKSAKLVFEGLSKITQNQIVISEAVKKSIKFQMKLDQNADFLITGIRLRIDFSVARQPQNCIILKLFNRVFKCKNYNNGPSPNPLWFEIPFCDAEVLYGCCLANNMQLELSTDDPKIFPINIAAMEVYGMSKKDFGYKEKVRRLEKLGSDKKSVLTAQTSERVDDSIKDELLKTRGIPLVSWKERVFYLKDQIDQKQLDVIQTLDVITQYIGITNKIDNQMFQNLVEKLRGVLSNSIIDNSSQGLVQAGVKRCLRKILSVLRPNAILGDPMNYKTVKDQIMVNVINNRLNSSDLTLKEVRSFIVSLLNIYNKRPYQIFKIIESHQDLIQQLTRQFISLNRPRADSKEIMHDIKGLFDLIIACYQQKINQNDCQLLTESESIEAAINRVYSEDSLIGFFEIIQPFILNEDDYIQRITLSVILNLVGQYSRSMSKSLKFNKLPQVLYSCDGAVQQKKLNILIVDFTPHLLKFVFTLVNKAQTLSSQGDVTYSLAYKLVYSFDQNCKDLYDGKFNDQLVLTISTFITNILVQPLSLSPENCSGSTADKFLYANLVLCNILMMQAMKDTKMRIKGSKLGLESQTQKRIIEMLQTDNDSTIKIIQWSQQVLQTYQQAFKNQKCSMRIKMDEGMPGDVYEVIAGQNNGSQLLRPISETSSWKWHPLFVHTDQQFELLDRKIPAQILLNIQFVLGHFNSLEKLESATALPMKLVMAIREFAFKKPAKSFLKVIGEQSIKQILQAINKSSTDQQQKIDNLLQVQIKGSVAFEEFYEIYQVLYSKNLAKRALSFNLQFQLHSFLQKTWKKASEHPDSWTYFISEQTPSRLNLLTQLFESAFVLNEDSAQLCLQLISLVFDHSVLFSFRQNETISISIFSVFQRNIEKQASVIPIKRNLHHLDLLKLIEVMLLGRNKKHLRVGAAHFLKGLYDKVEGMQSTIRDIMIEKIPQLRTQGVNSIEFIALLSYITNRDIYARGVTEQLYSRLTSQIYKEVLRSNQQLTAHENLELYAALQKMTNAFATNSTEIILGAEEETLKKLLMIEKDASSLFGGRSPDGSSRSSKITNPYLLESEACQRCYAQKSLPFTQHRLNDVKAEAKFTDSTMVYRFTSTYMIKQIQISQDGFKGNKVINEINVYINNKQGVDLAEMKNNWSLWKKVKTQEVSPGQKQITIDFTLPVTASNLLLEYHTANNGKINHHKDKAQQRQQQNFKPKKEACKIESINEVKGIDQVIRALPKRIAQKLGIVSSVDGTDSPNKDENGAVIDKDQMACPRCGKVVQGKHGVCNSCGENALQCNFCRNINYEKPDGFLCNECGMSRFAKLDVAFTVKQGLAAERIETEEAKTQALGQIEQNLIASQNAYSQLMKKRTTIASLTKRINEGGSECGKIVTDMYTEECADLYMKMMKSLSSIKILKYEIDQYTQGGSSKGPAAAQDLEQEAPSLTRTHSTLQNDEDYAQESCFSCIQEYLKGLLSFIQVTSDKLASQYKSQGFIDLLYKQNIKMYTSALQDPARKAICSLLSTDEAQTITLLQQIQEDLFKKKLIIPTHLLAANINQETYLVLDFLKQQTSLGDISFYKTVLDYMWQILFKALNEGSKNAAIADQIGGSFISYIKDVITKSQPAESEVKINMTTLLLSMFTQQEATTNFTVCLKDNLQGKNFLLFALTIGSSQKIREEAKEIISHLYSNGDEFLHIELLKQLLSTLDRVLEQASAGDQYFDILTQILNPATIKEKITSDSLRKESHNHIYVEAFDLLFKQIDRELNKLVKQENQRLALGADGFMPQISMGQTFARVVSLVSAMIKESPHLKGIIQNNVSIVIKSFLKVKKLNLTKNKVIQTSEVEIEKMFKELHSQREEDKQNFILECIKIIESGECDYQEMRFLFEEMCKVIDPAKPEPDYLLNLNRPQSQEFYFRGKMSKNPYTSSQLGKTMSDVRLKICKEMELAEPELVELLVAGKIVAMELSITQVYEQVHWPAMCRQRNPDIYEIPKIEDTTKQNLQPMAVIYRLMGIDGEANEDRIESLSDGSEADSDPANLQKRYGITQAICTEFESKRHLGTNTNGVQVLLDVLESFGPLQQSRYLAEWLFKMIGLALKLKSNRIEFMKYKHAVDHLAKRLFESVGMQSQIEGQKGMTLFDVILVILEEIIGEVTILEDPNLVIERMEIDHENAEAATHVQIFIQILTDSCEEMLSNHHALDKTSKKIRAVSKILPFLINKEDKSAHQIIISFIAESLTKIPLLDQLSQMNSKEKFIAQFNIERVIDIIDSTPVTKNFFKDQISENCGQLLESIWSYLLSTTLSDLSSENSVYKHKLANQYSLKLVHSLFKNNPQAQNLLYHSNSALVSKIYELTQAKYKDKLLTIIAQDIIDSVTNNNFQNDQTLKEHYKNLIAQQSDEKKKLAQKKREEIMKQMDLKKKQNQFLKQIGTSSMQEEVGPKCIVCLEGYTKKPTDVLGMYVFSKKLKVSEVSQSGNGFITTQGYTTVTHSSFIHFTCHQNAFRADSQLKQPKKEWEGAVIRNEHTKCNNLFPVKGGNLPTDAYAQMVERYFQVQAKSAGQCDPDRVKVMQHDFKLVIKRLAYEDSFSRDTHGGGPEHNMHLVPFMIQMINYLLNANGGFAHANNTSSSTDKFSYVQERKISEFLDQGMKLKRDFLQKMEEEKKADEIEEEEKQMNDDDSSVNDNEEDSNFSLDQIGFMLSQCIIFCQLPRWEQYKYKFFSIILCTISGMKDDQAYQPNPAGQQTDFATGKKVLTFNKCEAEDTPMVNADAFRGLSGSGTDLNRSGRRRLSSDNKSELIQKALIRIRPLLVLMRLVDSIKQRWDGKRLGILTDQSMLPKHEDYLRRLVDEFLSRGNLQEVIGECDALFREYKDKMLKISSVEEFLQEMGMVVGDVEQFILSHF